MSLLPTKSYLSAYLMTEAPRRRPLALRYRWYQPARLWLRLQLIVRLASGRVWASLALWLIIFSVGWYGTQHHTLPVLPASVAAADGPLASPAASPGALRPVVKAPSLPDGPTGQLLPPGTMAPQGSYPNSYSRGQCTWYVAGRRPVPSGWGNANTWFGRAQAAGWATGTTPAIAAIAWTPTGYYGHVALVEDVNATTGEVLISEMNYLGPYQLDKRWVSAGTFKYIY
jgi:hypothetical protein